MSDITKAAQRAAWGTIFRGASVGRDGLVDMPVNLIVMSRESAREIMRSQGHADIERGRDKTQPDRIYGIRIAYDDSLALGVFLPAHCAT